MDANSDMNRKEDSTCLGPLSVFDTRLHREGSADRTSPLDMPQSQMPTKVSVAGG